MPCIVYFREKVETTLFQYQLILDIINKFLAIFLHFL